MPGDGTARVETLLFTVSVGTPSCLARLGRTVGQGGAFFFKILENGFFSSHVTVDHLDVGTSGGIFFSPVPRVQTPGPGRAAP